MDYLKTSYSEFINYKNSSKVSINFLENDNIYDLYLFNGNFKLNCIVQKTNPKNADQLDFENNYKILPESNNTINSKVDIAEQTPFAKPDYRTKRAATSNWEVCAANTTTLLDYQITEERYVTGGEIIFKNVKEGDYITAEVYDKDYVIPEAYRASLCENHPTVAEYVEKKWLVPTETDKYDKFEIDTYPLNAKISAGLYLRITYYASSETGDRKCAINYNLSKKL